MGPLRAALHRRLAAAGVRPPAPRRGRARPGPVGLGPDAWTITVGELVEALRGSRAPLKARLLDQHRVAGLGNLLVDETLWRAGLDPARPAADLDGTSAGAWPAHPLDHHHAVPAGRLPHRRPAGRAPPRRPLPTRRRPARATDRSAGAPPTRVPSTSTDRHPPRAPAGWDPGPAGGRYPPSPGSHHPRRSPVSPSPCLTSTARRATRAVLVALGLTVVVLAGSTGAGAAPAQVPTSSTPGTPTTTQNLLSSSTTAPSTTSAAQEATSTTVRLERLVERRRGGRQPARLVRRRRPGRRGARADRAHHLVLVPHPSDRRGSSCRSDQRRPARTGGRAARPRPAPRRHDGGAGRVRHRPARRPRRAAPRR